MNISSVNFSSRNPLNAKSSEETMQKLNKAANEAGLNVTERMALNDEYFPNGNGLELFPEDVREHQITNYHNPNEFADTFETKDGFSIEVDELAIPEHVSVVKREDGVTDKDNFHANLDNAIEKLKKFFNPEKK